MVANTYSRGTISETRPQKFVSFNLYLWFEIILYFSRPQSLSLPGQSLLDALDEHEFQESQGSKSDALECRVCIDDDDEQTTAVVVPTNTLEAGEYKIPEEEASDNSEGDTSGANKDDVVDNIDFDHDTTDDVQEPPSVSRYMYIFLTIELIIHQCCF